MKAGTLFIIVLIVLCICTCSPSENKNDPAPLDTVMIDSLNRELSKLQEQIDATIKSTVDYQGGLIKSLIDARITTMRLSQDMLRHRLFAIKSRVSFDYSLEVIKPDTVLAAKILKELESMDAELSRAKQEAEKYTGGLLHVLALSTVATTEQTIAMLNYRYLSAKYGLPIPDMPINSTPSASISDAVSPGGIEEVSDPKPASPSIEILSVDAKVTESNDVWSKYAWKVSIKNLSDDLIVLDVTVEFQDEDGFIIDDDTESREAIQPNSEKVVSGYALINADVAGNVDKINARVTKSF